MSPSSTLSPILILTLAILTLLIHPTLSVDLCFFPSNNPSCNQATSDFRCCRAASDSECCLQDTSDWCHYGSGDGLSEVDKVEWFETHKCPFDPTSTCMLEDAGVPCCNAFREDQSAPGLCAMVYQSFEKRMVRGGEVLVKASAFNESRPCRVADHFGYRDGEGEMREIFVPEGQGREVEAMIKAKKWVALKQKYPENLHISRG